MILFSRGTIDGKARRLRTSIEDVAQGNGSKWDSINELKKEYPSASILKVNRIDFDIKGNDYRLIVNFMFEYQLAWIRFIGTHAEYDKINANKN